MSRFVVLLCVPLAAGMDITESEKLTESEKIGKECISPYKTYQKGRPWAVSADGHYWGPWHRTDQSKKPKWIKHPTLDSITIMDITTEMREKWEDYAEWQEYVKAKNNFLHAIGDDSGRNNEGRRQADLAWQHCVEGIVPEIRSQPEIAKSVRNALKRDVFLKHLDAYFFQADAIGTAYGEQLQTEINEMTGKGFDSAEAESWAYTLYDFGFMQDIMFMPITDLALGRNEGVDEKSLMAVYVSFLKACRNKDKNEIQEYTVEFIKVLKFLTVTLMDTHLEGYEKSVQNTGNQEKLVEFFAFAKQELLGNLGLSAAAFVISVFPKSLKYFTRYIGPSISGNSLWVADWYFAQSEGKKAYVKEMIRRIKIWKLLQNQAEFNKGFMNTVFSLTEGKMTYAYDYNNDAHLPEISGATFMNMFEAEVHGTHA